ncbi:hypothetical protein V6N13_120899 [Hibiscus sabdariffa]
MFVTGGSPRVAGAGTVTGSCGAETIGTVCSVDDIATGGSITLFVVHHILLVSFQNPGFLGKCDSICKQKHGEKGSSENESEEADMLVLVSFADWVVLVIMVDIPFERTVVKLRREQAMRWGGYYDEKSKQDFVGFLLPTGQSLSTSKL